MSKQLVKECGVIYLVSTMVYLQFLFTTILFIGGMPFRDFFICVARLHGIPLGAIIMWCPISLYNMVDKQEKTAIIKFIQQKHLWMHIQIIFFIMLFPVLILGEESYWLLLVVVISFFVIVFNLYLLFIIILFFGTDGNKLYGVLKIQKYFGTWLSGCFVRALYIKKLSVVDFRYSLHSTPQLIDNFIHLERVHIKHQNEYPVHLMPPNGTKIVLIKFNNFHSIPSSAFFNVPSSLTNLTFKNNFRLNTLPASLNNLTNLEYLNISEPNLISIHQESLYSSITRLKILVLHTPSMDLKKNLLCNYLTSLTTLSISSNHLITIPDALSISLPHLTVFNIENTPNLTSLEPIFQCTQLTHLCLTNVIHPSNTTGISSGISKLVNLKRFAAFNNGLTNTTTLEISCIDSISSSIDNLTNLQELWIVYNSSLSSLPLSIGNLTNLQKLGIFCNKSLSSLPSSIGNLINLKKLKISRNDPLSSLPLSIGNLTNLKKLGICGNNSLSSLPSSIGNLINLQELGISENDSISSLPLSIGNLINLQNLWITYNKSLSLLPSSILNFGKHVQICVRGIPSLSVSPLPTIKGFPSLKDIAARICTKLLLLKINK